MRLTLLDIQGGSNEYQQSIFRAKIRRRKKKTSENCLLCSRGKSLYIAWACFVVMVKGYFLNIALKRKWKI